MQYSILLVEDSPSDAELIQEMLFEQQFDFNTVDRLTQAIKCLEAASFDLVLLDLNLPDSEGLQTFLKLYNADPQTPIVILSGLDDDQVAQRALGLGAQDYLNKSTVASKLLSHAIRYAIERARLQTQLRQSEMRYRELFENAQDIIYTQAIDGTITSINREFERLLGFSSDEVIGKKPEDIAELLGAEQKSDFASWLDLLAKLQSDEKITKEFVVRNNRGELTPLELTNRLIYRDGEIIGVQGIARDISERREAVKALANSERDFRLLAENSSDMISRHDPDGVYLYVSPACFKLLGYRPDELVGRSAYEFFHPDDLEAITRSHQHILNSPDTYTVEYRIRKKNGEYIWFESTKHHVKSPDTGEIIEVQTTSRDISERKQAEVEIQAAHQFVRNTVNALSAHIAIVDENGQIIATNDAWDDFALNNGGSSDSTGVGTNYLTVAENVTDSSPDASDAKKFARGLRDVLDGKTHLFSQEYACHSPDEQRWFSGIITRFEQQGEVRAVIAHENITERKKLEEDLLQRSVRAAILRDIAVVTNIQDDVDRSLSYAVERLAKHFNYDVGHIYLAHEGKQQLIPSKIWYLADEQNFEPFVEATEKCEIPILGLGFIRRAMHSQEIIYFSELPSSDEFVRTDAARTSNLQSGIAVPILSRDQVVAAIELFSTHAIDVLNEEMKDFLNSVGTILGRVIERQRSAKQIQAREERFSTLIHNSSDVISIFDPDAIALYHSPVIESVMGYPVDEIVGRGIYEFIHPDDRKVVKEKFNQLLSNQEENVTFELQLRHADGTWRWLEAVISNQVTNPAINGIIVNSRDITARKLVEENLLSLNRDLNYLHEIGSALASTIDIRQIGWAIFTRLAMEILDSPHFVLASYDNDAQLIQCRFAIIDGDEQPPEAFPTLPLGEGPTSDAIRTRKIQVVDLQTVRQKLEGTGRVKQIGDEQLPQSALYIPVISDDRVSGVMSFQSYDADAYVNIDFAMLTTIATQVSVAVENGLLYQQVQDHVQHLEKRVQERTEDIARVSRRVSAILNNASDAILLIADNDTIETTNPAFDNTFGYSTDELFAQPLQAIADADSVEDLLQVVQEVRRTGMNRRKQIKCRRKDHSLFDAEIALAMVPNNEDHLVCTIFDITQYKVVERMKDQFISMVNHELRTPVAAMIVTSSTLQIYYDRLSEDQRLRKIEQIRRQADLMSELINAVLDISKIEAQSDDDRHEEVDMVSVLANVVSELHPTADDKQQILRNITDCDQAIIYGDVTEFSRIWRNLIGNAIKYTPEHGEITVQTIMTRPGHNDLLFENLPEGQYIVGIVSDNGPGISPDDQKQLFTRFFRGWAKQSQIPGTGLGLALVRESLRSYNGDIKVDSIIDEGTTFTFWIPIHS